MRNEAERLANELTEAVECFPEPTRLESAAASLLRSQAAEIERLRAEANTCGSGAGCCAQAAEIERLTAELGDLPEAQAMLLRDCKRKNALLREAVRALKYHSDQTRPIERTFDTMGKIKTELGKQT